jgi:hypothetical protein
MRFVGTIIVQFLVDVRDPLSFKSGTGWNGISQMGASQGKRGSNGAMGDSVRGGVGYSKRGGVGHSKGSGMCYGETGSDDLTRWAGDDCGTVNWSPKAQTQTASEETSIGGSDGYQEDGKAL